MRLPWPGFLQIAHTETHAGDQQQAAEGEEGRRREKEEGGGRRREKEEGGGRRRETDL